MELHIEKIIKLMLLVILLLSGLLYWYLPKTNLRSKLKMNEKLFVVTQIVGMLCGATGLIITFIYPQFIVDYHLWELLIIPYVIVQVYWMTIMKIRKTSEILDEKQEHDMAKAGGVTMGLSILAMVIMFTLYERDIMQGLIWFPFYLFITIAVFSGSTLFYFKHGSLALFIGFMLMLPACTNTQDMRQENTEPSFVINDTDLTRLNQWLGFQDLSMSDFDTLTEESANFIVMEKTELPDLEIFGDFFIYSSDSSQYIDLDSYSKMIEIINDQLRHIGSEPDTEVAVVNPTESTRTRILFCGPACVPEEALWVGNDIIYVLGHADETGSQYLPFIHVYDLNEKSVKRLSSNKPGKSPNKYVEEVRMQEVDFHYHESVL